MYISLQEGWGGATFTDTYTWGTWDTPYYPIITKNGTDLTCKIYSDSSRLTLLDTLNLTLHADHTFRYNFVANTWNDGTNEHMDVDVDYLSLTGSGEWTNTDWINDTYVTGDSPYVDITSLAVGTTYYFRVQARNAMGTVNGSELNFTTFPAIFPPTNFTAYPDSSSISLTWTKGIGTAYTMIRGQAGDYPANYTDGDQVYAGFMSTALHDGGLIPGTTYYYRSYSYDGAGYSDNYTDIMMTLSLIHI